MINGYNATLGYLESTDIIERFSLLKIYYKLRLPPLEGNTQFTINSRMTFNLVVACICVLLDTMLFLCKIGQVGCEQLSSGSASSMVTSGSVVQIGWQQLWKSRLPKLMQFSHTNKVLMFFKLVSWQDYVKISTGFSSMCKESSAISPSKTCFLTKWCFVLICLIIAWKTWLWASFAAPWLPYERCKSVEVKFLHAWCLRDCCSLDM